MRIKYNGFLLSDATAQLKRFPLPEPPTEEEMAAELAGIERLEEALEAMNEKIDMNDKYGWHEVTKKDQARIQCGDAFNSELKACGRPATQCLHTRFERNGMGDGISFSYYCDEHATAVRQRLSPVPFSEPSLEPSYNDLMLEKQRRKRR